MWKCVGWHLRGALQRCRGKQRFWVVCIGWKMCCGRARTTATPSIPHYTCGSSNDMSSKLANTLGTSSFATDCVASLWPLGNVRKIVRRKESIWTWKFHALEGCILFTVPHQVLDINRNAIKLRCLNSEPANRHVPWIYPAFAVSREVFQCRIWQRRGRKIAHLISKRTNCQNTSLPQKLIEPMSVRQMSTNCHLNRKSEREKRRREGEFATTWEQWQGQFV